MVSMLIEQSCERKKVTRAAIVTCRSIYSLFLLTIMDRCIMTDEIAMYGKLVSDN